MPTPKQVRFHYGRVMRLHEKLGEALIAAHQAGVIDYEGYVGVAPCEAHDMVRERIKKTCEKQLALAMHKEILKRNW